MKDAKISGMGVTVLRIQCILKSRRVRVSPYTIAILRSCKARLLLLAAKQNFILNRVAV